MSSSDIRSNGGPQSCIFLIYLHLSPSLSLSHYVCVFVCVSPVAEKTTGAVGNIVAATGLVKKDEFPADMNVCAARPYSVTRCFVACSEAE